MVFVAERVDGCCNPPVFSVYPGNRRKSYVVEDGGRKLVTHQLLLLCKHDRMMTEEIPQWRRTHTHTDRKARVHLQDTEIVNLLCGEPSSPSRSGTKSSENKILHVIAAAKIQISPNPRPLTITLSPTTDLWPRSQTQTQL